MQAIDTLGARLVPVPDAAPPYDAQAAGPLTGEQWPADVTRPGQLTLDDLLVAEATANAAAGQRAEAAWPAQIAQAIVETLAGTRPLRQVFPWTTDRTQERVKRLSTRLRTDTRPRMQRVLTSRPSAGAMELTVIAEFGARTRALAMRFEHVPAREASPGRPARPDRWLCTDLETG
jgi:hypothetical protein